MFEKVHLPMLKCLSFFNCLSFHCFVQVNNEIWYLRKLIIALPGYQISLITCTSD